jgi:hypothetical protein
MITYKMSESNNNVEMNVSEVADEVKEVKLNEVGVTVTLEFLVNVRNILDVCTTRSVWKSNELSTIGRLYDGINEVIKNKVAEASVETTVLPSVPE